MIKGNKKYRTIFKAFLAFSFITIFGIILSVIPHIPLIFTGIVNTSSIISLFVVFSLILRTSTPSEQKIAEVIKGNKSIEEIPIPIKFFTQKEYEKRYFKNYSSEIEQYYREILTREPNDEKTWEKLCFTLMVKQNAEGVINVALDGLRLFKNNYNLLGFIVLAYEHQEEYEKAEEIRRNNELPQYYYYNFKRDLRKVRKWIKKQ